MRTDRVETELLKLVDDAGRLTPEQIVAAAEPEEHALHDQFEWDDSIAGHKYRLDQARVLMRRVEVRFQIDRRIVRTVAYVRDPQAPDGEQGYVAVVKLRQNPDAAREAVIAEFARAAAHLRRARDLATVLGTDGEEIEALIGRVTRLQERIDDAAVAAPANA